MSKRKKVSVLVVDDYPDGREMVAEYLAFRGYAVNEAKDGLEAVELTRKLKPQIVLMDLQMPGVDGWEGDAPAESRSGHEARRGGRADGARAEA